MSTQKYELLSSPKTLDELQEEFSIKYITTNPIRFHEIPFPHGGHKIPAFNSLNQKQLDEYIIKCANQFPEPLLDWYRFLSNASKVLKETPNSEILRSGQISFYVEGRAQQSNDPYRQIWVEDYYYRQVSTSVNNILDKYNSKVKLLNEQFMKDETAREERIKCYKERTEWLSSEQSRKLIEDEAKKRIEQEKLKKIEDEAKRRIEEQKHLFEQAVQKRMDELRN